MKFLKHTQRSKASRKSSIPLDAENIPPHSQATHKALKPHSCPSTMEAEEPERLCTEEETYRDDIIAYLVQRPETLKTEANYFVNQPNVTEHMRAVLLNWMVDVHLKYRLQPETLFVAVHILDGYMSKRVVCRSELQLVGICALWIASKYQQTYQVPKLANLIFICDSAFTGEQILAMEACMIQTLQFQVLTLTSFHYLQCLQKLSCLAPKDYYFCRYMIEICLFSVSFKKYHPRIIASAAVFFVNKLRHKGQCWPTQLAEAFQISQQGLKPCARDICTFWHRISEMDTLVSLRSKFTSESLMEVAKIKIAQSHQGREQSYKLRA